MFATILSTIRRWRMKTLKPFGHVPGGTLRVSLGDTNPDMARALAGAFAGIEAVEVVEGSLLDLACDAIVSPANSLGDMGGGIDKAIDDFHRGEAQRCVMAAIAEQHFGELPVGSALVVAVPGRRFPFVVAAPTMRIPGSVAGSINAYLSMRAVCVAVLRHNATQPAPIRSVAVPGLGTGVGAMRFDDAAEQMRTAYDQVIGERWRDIVHAAQAPYVMRK